MPTGSHVAVEQSRGKEVGGSISGHPAVNRAVQTETGRASDMIYSVAGSTPDTQLRFVTLVTTP